LKKEIETMPDQLTPDQFTSPDQFHDAANLALESYEKETDDSKKGGYLKSAREYTSKAKELYSKEKEAAAKGKQFAIPETYKTKPWAAKIKSEEDLYKQIDSLDATVGKKDVPFDYEGKTPDEIKQHFDARRPAKPDDYKIGKDTDDKTVVSTMKTIFYEAGLDQYQAHTALEKLRGFEESQKAKLFDADEYNVILEKAFGKEFKKEAGLSSNVLKQHVTKDEQEFFDKNFPNEHAAFVHKLVNRIAKKYGITESDKGVGGGKGGSGKGGEDAVTSRKAEIRKQLNEIAKRPHTQAEKGKLIAELTELNRTKK
jgi:hypothetical protein